MLKKILMPSLNWLLLFVILTLGYRYFWNGTPIQIFCLSAIAIIPLAGWMGKATEHIAHRAGEGIGGLINATFGNAAELIIALFALKAGLIDLVKASITGSIIGNILLVMGMSFLLGGAKFQTQRFNSSAARIQSSMLTLGAITLLLEAAYHHIYGAEGATTEKSLSFAIACVLIITYILGLLFSLKTHKELFAGPKSEETLLDEESHHTWSVSKSVGVLAIATTMVAWMSEILIGSVEHAAQVLGMTEVFVGVIVVAVVGNAAEHSTAILVAMKNKMDLSVGISIGSSIQIALFVAPVLLFASYFMGPGPIDLVFTPFEVLAVAVSVAITGQIAGDGESNWFEGAQLLSVYLILGLVFYFLPV